MTGRRNGWTRRLFARRAIAAAVLGLAGVVGAAPPTAALEPIRIALGDGLRHVEIGVADTLTVSDPAAGRVLFSVPGPRILRVIPAGAGLDVVGARRVDLTRIRLETRRGPLRVGTRDYIGALEIWRQPEGLLLVNEVPMEEYIGGTVRGEASERWPAEALRALAVAARTYAVFQQGRAAGRAYHVVASNQDQNFAGWAIEGSPAREAARMTAGQVLTWQGRVFPTFYHSDSGGFTEAAQSVFSGDGVPPLEGVRDEFSMESPNYTWTVTLPLTVIGERLRRGGIEVGQVTRLTVLERSPSFRVARLAVEHSARDGYPPGGRLPPAHRVRCLEEHAVRPGRPGRCGAVRGARLGARRGPVPVRRQGHGRPRIHVSSDPRSLLPGHRPGDPPMRGPEGAPREFGVP